MGANAVLVKPVSIDFVLSGNLSEDIGRAVALGNSSNPFAQKSSEAILQARIDGLPPGKYSGEKIGDKWYFKPQQQHSYPYH
ncbi:MAG: hypothetical protein AABX33_01500 [Nanoarchaeota archaeon]